MALEEKKKNRAKRDPSSEINLESPGNEDLDLLIPANMRIGSPPSAQAAGASGAGVAPGAGPAGSAGPAGPAVLGPDASGVSGSVDGQAGTAPGGAGALGTAENHGEIPAEVENAVIPLVWARGYPGRSKQAEPVSITLKPGATPKLQQFVELSRLRGLDTPAHQFQPGDWVYIKWWDSDPLRAKWRGPFQVLLTSLTAVKVAGKGPWFHYSRVKKASVPGTISKAEPDSEEEDVA
ncbi:T-cell leukemia homeobox protein 1-like isoform X1 [Myiozetetes cayanensis]|uniref:T-cell leukemia homeobox protein 1-like isoform X1 n=1 Tax=Myiozetetes cayanensis TaxID=478635 RepID=UPI00215E9F01|nr:T-cell leukemia homeobox protein 1-like isoform X1 [Myiozetetes cayanensis]